MGQQLDFRAYEFEQNGRPLFVFVSIQEDRVTGASPMADSKQWNLRNRVLAAWEDTRNLGQRLLEIAVTGFDDFSQAKAPQPKPSAKSSRWKNLFAD